MVNGRLMLPEDAGDNLLRLLNAGLSAGVPANKPPTAVCKNVTVAAGAAVCSAAASVDAGSSDPDGDPLTFLQTPAGPYSLGATGVALTATDGFVAPFGASSSCTGTVTVVDRTPPGISSLLASPSVLWPPNHKMVPVTVSVNVSDACDAGVGNSCQIVSVTSNERARGREHGEGPDYVITGRLTVSLRAERSGERTRVYTIGVRCTDASGNSSTKAVSVKVRHDRDDDGDDGDDRHDRDD